MSVIGQNSNSNDVIYAKDDNQQTKEANIQNQTCQVNQQLCAKLSGGVQNEEDETNNAPKQEYFTSSSSSANSDYFESSSQSQSSFSEHENVEVDKVNDKIYSFNSSQNFSLLFANQNGDEKQLYQQNSEALHRQEFGGVVVYDSQARIIGNQKLQEYYENNPPVKVDFNILFSPSEIAKADKLFYKEPRERDFQNDFDKFLYRHLPKFQSQRDYQSQNQYTINVPQQENILIFDSRFENGNLRRAIKVNNVEYNLWLENDLNTKGHTQWYYFKVIHKYPKRQKIQFKILNLAKPQSLYQYGMKPCIYSRRQQELYGKKWFRGGEEVKYFQNDIPRKVNNSTANINNSNHNVLYNNNGAGEGLEYHFTFSFVYEFDEEEDEVWFAHAIPYSFTDLQNNIVDLQTKSEGQNIFKANILCKDLTGSPCPLITITDHIDSYIDYYDDIQLSKELPNLVKKQLHKKYQKSKKLYKQSLESKGKVRKLLRAACEEEINSFYQSNADVFKAIDPRFDHYNTKLKASIENHSHKKAIIITSRVHPGEPQASYMLQGTLEYLCSEEAKELRRHFVFRIMPMLNVDGVIYGNYRCSLLGVDLNRKWTIPNIFLHPSIYYAKQLVKNMHNERRVLLFCDLHGHSRKQNCFFYACTYKNFEHEGRIKNAQVRMIPLLCCHKNKLFNFKDCRFRIEKCKESTARVVVFREFNIMNAFTLECSFFGKEESETEISNNQRSYQHLPEVNSLYSGRNNQTKINHFGIKDYMSIGATLPMVLNNYLPKEQSKLDILSGKILEIFYDEFIKLIPPYVLKREEERKKQLGLLENQETVPPLTTGKSPTIRLLGGNQSPKQQNQISKSFSLKKPSKSLIGSEQLPQIQTSKKQVKTEIEKVNNQLKKPKKKKIIGKKDSEKIAERDIIRQQSETENDTFSQIINIHSSQEELIELEMFIKGIQDKMKVYESKGEKGASSGDEEGNGNATDSSDSEESVKNIYVQQKQKENKSFSKAGGQRKTLKKPIPLKKIKEQPENINEPQKDDSQIKEIKGTGLVFQSIDGKPISTKSKRRLTIIKQQANNLASIESFKFKPLSHNIFQPVSEEIRSNQRVGSRDSELKFDKITHRKSTSRSISIHEEDLIKPQQTLSRNVQGTSTMKSCEGEKDDNQLTGGIVGHSLYFKSYEDIKHQNHLQAAHNLVSGFDRHHHVLPLYENPIYHQKRLNNQNESQDKSPNTNSNNNNGGALTGSCGNNSLVNNPNNGSLGGSTSMATGFNLRNLNNGRYEPYEDLTRQNQGPNSLIRPVTNVEIQSIPQKQIFIPTSQSNQPKFTKQSLGILSQLMISPMLSSETNETKKIPLHNQGHNHHPTQQHPNPHQLISSKDEIYSNRQQTHSKNNQSNSLQRISFKELLETSRQQRVNIQSNDRYPQQQQSIRQTTQNQSLYSQQQQQNGLLQMLRSTYKRFQQQQASTMNTRQDSSQLEEEKDSSRISGISHLDYNNLMQIKNKRQTTLKEPTYINNPKSNKSFVDNRRELYSINSLPLNHSNREGDLKVENYESVSFNNKDFSSTQSKTKMIQNFVNSNLPMNQKSIMQAPSAGTSIERGGNIFKQSKKNQELQKLSYFQQDHKDSLSVTPQKKIRQINIEAPINEKIKPKFESINPSVTQNGIDTSVDKGFPSTGNKNIFFKSRQQLPPSNNKKQKHNYMITNSSGSYINTKKSGDTQNKNMFKKQNKT